MFFSFKRARVSSWDNGCTLRKRKGLVLIFFVYLFGKLYEEKECTFWFPGLPRLWSQHTNTLDLAKNPSKRIAWGRWYRHLHNQTLRQERKWRCLIPGIREYKRWRAENKEGRTYGRGKCVWGEEGRQKRHQERTRCVAKMSTKLRHNEVESLYCKTCYDCK